LNKLSLLIVLGESTKLALKKDTVSKEVLLSAVGVIDTGKKSFWTFSWTAEDVSYLGKKLLLRLKKRED